MTAQETAIETVRAAAERITGEPVTVGLLPEEGGIAFQAAAGSTEFCGLNRAYRRRVLALDFLAKYTDQRRAYGLMCELGNSLEAMDFTDGAVVNVMVRSEPSFVGKTGDFWIYSLPVNVRVEI